MAYDYALEDLKAAKKQINDYYPDICRFHKNEILTYLDACNNDYVIKRKEKFNKIKTKSDASVYIEHVRKSFQKCLGEFPGSREVNASVVGIKDMGNYCIDLVLIESLPGYFLTANFYYPKNLSVPGPSVLFLCGHSPTGKGGEFTYVSFCAEAVLNGFCVLTFDPVGQGERRFYDAKDSGIFDEDNPDNVHYLLGQQVSLIGDSITAYMMWDNIKALDYLLSRMEADPCAVSAVGNSGGGQMAAFMGALDDRIGAVVSSCYITELKTMIYHIGAQESEQSLHGFMKEGLDIADLIIAAAPKPYFFGAGLFDFFPIEGTRDAFIDCSRIYALLEKKENINIFIAPKPHGFYWETRDKALRFLCSLYGKDFLEDKGIDYGKLPSEQELLCTETGNINDFNTITLQKIISEKGKGVYPQNQAIDNIAGLKAFSEAVRKNLFEVFDIDINSIRADIAKAELNKKDRNIFVTEYTFFSEDNMKIYGSLYEKEKGSKVPVLLSVGAVLDKELYDFLEEFPAVFSVETRGTGRGAVEPGSFFFEPTHFQNEEASYNCNASMLGRNVAGMRLTDALAAVKLLKSIKEFDNCRMTIAGTDENALTALYTAVALGGCDVRLSNLLYSFKSIVDNRMYIWGPSIFAYGILKYFDIPELLAAVLASGSIKINGLLDNMKEKADTRQIQEILSLVRELGGVGGHKMEIC